MKQAKAAKVGRGAPSFLFFACRGRRTEPDHVWGWRQVRRKKEEENVAAGGEPREMITPQLRTVGLGGGMAWRT